MLKKKVLIQINTVGNGSTGRIMHDIQDAAEHQGYTTLSFVGRRTPFSDLPCEKFGDFCSFWIHVIWNTIFDRQGFASRYVTKKLLVRLREEKPDIIHLHNMHGYYLNLPILFKYLKKEFNGKLVWTFHDCWPFTGHCAYFTMAGCEKWKKKCNKCVCKKRYPISLFFDASTRNYEDKKKLFTGINNLTIVTPSKWMRELIQQSFMGEYPVEVIANGIDLTLFRYKKDIKILQKYNIPLDKKIILGIANVWDERKGLRDFTVLATKLSEEYKIVLVGLSKMQIKKLPFSIIGIERTENIEELVCIYSAAQVFLNPSREESFSMVTIEAIACGTPAIVLDNSAVKELVNEDNGIVLHEPTIEMYKSAIRQLESKAMKREDVAKTALVYEKTRILKQLVALYE